MSRKWAARGLAAVSVIGALTLTACSADAAGSAPSGASSAAPVEGGAMSIGLDREVPSLDPADGAIVQQPVFVVANAIYEPLLAPGPGGTMVPGLAESVTADATGLTWTIELPEGLAFSDGSPLTADSVKLHLERLNDPATQSAAAAQTAQITEMQVESDTTLVLTLTAPNADFDAQFARALGMVTSTTANDEYGFPLGAGPYQVEKFVGGDSIIVVRNENYGGDKTGHLDEIAYRMMPDAESRLQSLQAGDLDLMWTEVTSQFQQARDDASLTVHAAPAAVSSIMLNLQSPKFADHDVREALAQAIDRDAVNAVVNLGEGTPVDNPYALLGDLAPDVDYPQHDVAAAKQVLEGKNLAFDLTVNNRTETIQRGTVLKDILSEVGVTVTLKPVDPAEFGAVLGANDFEAVDFVTSIYSDASGGLLTSRTGSPYNFGGYSDTSADEMLDAAAGETDAAERAVLLQGVAQNLADNLPTLWLTANNAGFIAQAEVAGMPNLDGFSLISVQPAEIGWREAQQ
ncbi:ABC transporter substrate-binding protein [Leucobacter sp. NPDC077196]|uniref:ABC transporter substrate-binding protein n=1 Tax=Leucobacter sp. NPDC077196 TaxID=3154959 RepID=UPI0034316245